jgi:predicted Zn-dependent protease
MNLFFAKPLLLIIGLFMLNGCQLLEFKKSTPPPKTDKNTVSTVKQLEAKGRYSEAIGLLESAISQDGKAERYTTALREIRLKQTTTEQELQDQLLISKTSALKNQVPIFEQLIRADQQNKEYAEKLVETERELYRLKDSLSECGWRQYKKNNALAKACLTLSLSLEEDEQDERLMTYLLDEQIEDKKKTENLERTQREMAWKHRNQKRLRQAERYSESGQLTEAKRILKLILKEDRKNKSAKSLLVTVDNRLKSYIENLLAAGDRLYREGEIEGAKATWRAALSLDPADKRAREKIDRAQRVLDNLENLRKSGPTNGN